jgi:hypothetical protein
MKKLYILIFLCLVFLIQLKAQKICGSDEYYNYLMTKDPEFAKNQELLELATQEYIKSANLKSATTGIIYTIPVVVHVLYHNNENDPTNVSVSNIQSQIEILNKDFQLRNEDRKNCPDRFKDYMADCQIEFKLAKRDPNGNCTNGIVRHKTAIPTFYVDGELADNAKFNNMGGHDAWNTSKYLNIWVVPQLKDEKNVRLGGYAVYPGISDEDKIDGVVVEYYYIGNSRVLTHEIGHWLNLKHIFGNYNCFDSDNVSDTPTQYGPNKPLENNECLDPETIKKSCPFEPKGDMFMNYMDYNINCSNIFTNGQKERMHAALNTDNRRKSVVSNSNLSLISPLADLTIVNQQVSSTSVNAGNSITVYFAEANDGSLAAPANYVNIHLSANDKLTPGENGDIYLDQYFIEQSVPGRTSTKEFSKEITIPSNVVPGDYFLFFAADGKGEVTECDDTNNFASKIITVKANNTPNPPRNLTAVTGDEQVTLSWLAPSSGIPNGYNIYRSSSETGTYSLISSNLKTTSKTITGLINGTTYWFYVQAVYATGERVASTKISAKPATSIKPPNDDCSGAILLTSSVSCNYLENQTVNNATASGKSKGSCDGYTGTPALADVWYYFKAQSTSHTITVDPNGSQLDAVIVAYNSCSSNTGINCSDIVGGPGTISTLNLSGLLIGDYYYIRVYDYGMQTTMGNFRICLTGEPANNSCIIASITQNSKTHGPASFSTTPGADDINFTAQPNCSFEITNYCSWLTVTPMSGTTNSIGLASLNYSIEANTSINARECIFYINGSPITITQNGEDGADDDNDGVINSIDLCPNTPNGAVVNENGCSDDQIITEINSLQFYDVLLNTPKIKTIGIFNNGTIDFTITSINITGEDADQFSITPMPPLVVSPDSYQNLDVTFNPTSVGAKEANIEIITNSIEIPLKTITLNGKGVDQLNRILICMPSKTYNFGNIKTTSSESKTFIIQNLGSDICTISGISLEGLNKENFSITSQSELPSILEVGEYFVVTVKFSPSSSGSKTATLNITNNSDNTAPVLPVELYGNGIIDVFSGTNNVIKSYEYWFNNDYDSKLASPTFYEDVSDLSFQFPTPNLEVGLHSFHIRYLDKKGYWSSVVSEFFHKLPVTAAGTREITACEYWFDDNYSNRVFAEITPGQTITSNTGFDVSALQTGLHSYHVRYKDDAGQWSSVVSEFFHKLPALPEGDRVITACEYWFDDDFANKVSVEITPGQTITTNEGFDVSALQTGLHSYHVRYKDDAGQWSSVVSEFFHKLPALPEGDRKITACEYWFDDDFANKISTEITPGQTITTNTGFDVSELQTGLHSYHVRYKDDAGQWSSVVSEFFHKLPALPDGDRVITACEYWFDNDYANKISTEITPGQTITTNEGFDVSSLTNGLHSYHVRYKDDAGQWSSVVSEFFHKLPVSSAQDNLITAYRYWFNRDEENIQIINLVTPVNPYELIRNISVAGLQTGYNTIHFQFKDIRHAWSSVVTNTFNLESLLVQEIALKTGWNISSTYIKPDNKDILSVFQPLIDDGKLRKVMDETGKTIENYGFFGGWQNDIGNLDNTRGYKVNLTAPATLSIVGLPVALPETVLLNAGWNIIGYPALSPQSALNIMQPLISAGVLHKVMDEEGRTIEDFGQHGGWTNNIGDFTPGKGYKVLVSQNASITIDDLGTKSAAIIPEVIPSSRFKPAFTGNGTDHMNLHLVSLLQSGLKEGDEIGIFDGNLCVGSARLTSANLAQNRISIAASANDGLDTAPNGFTTDNIITVKLFRHGEESALTLTRISPDPSLSPFPFSFLLSPFSFSENGSLFATAQTDLSTGVEEIDNPFSVTCYPNPFKQEITVEINLTRESVTGVEVINQLGQRVKYLAHKQYLPAGIHRFIWDGKDAGSHKVAPGIYLVRVIMDGTQVHHKIIMTH